MLAPEVGGAVDRVPTSLPDHGEAVATALEYDFDVWLGDDLVEGFPCYIVTSPLAESLQKADLSGFDICDVHVRMTEEFKDLYPARQLPQFRWLKVIAKAMAADFGVDDLQRLVVSEGALTVLRTMNISHCDVRVYDDMRTGST